MTTVLEPLDDPLALLGNLFRLLSDATRLRLLLLLAEGERDVGGLCTDTALPQPTISHHLSLLLAGGVAVVRREGKHRFYSLDEGRVMKQGEELHVGMGDTRVRIVLSEGRVMLAQPLLPVS
jgi:DNA-binding transcriptional ArsR family regulator